MGTLNSDELGEKGQHRFAELCEDAKLTCNPSQRDRTGWDFIVEFPFDPPTRNLRIERTAIHAVLPQGSRVLEPLPTSKDDDRRAQPLAHPVASMTATARLLADHELIITAPIVGGYVVPTRSSTCHSRVGALSRSPCCKGRGNRGVRCSSSERRQGER